jgi:hypothetical protein
METRKLSLVGHPNRGEGDMAVEPAGRGEARRDLERIEKSGFANAEVVRWKTDRTNFLRLKSICVALRTVSSRAQETFQSTNPAITARSDRSL